MLLSYVFIKMFGTGNRNFWIKETVVESRDMSVYILLIVFKTIRCNDTNPTKDDNGDKVYIRYRGIFLLPLNITHLYIIITIPSYSVYIVPYNKTLEKDL